MDINNNNERDNKEERVENQNVDSNASVEKDENSNTAQRNEGYYKNPFAMGNDMKNQGYDRQGRPIYRQGYDQDYNNGYGQGYNQGNGYGQGYNQGNSYGTGYNNQGYGNGYGPNYSQGNNYGGSNNYNGNNGSNNNNGYNNNNRNRNNQNDKKGNSKLVVIIVAAVMTILMVYFLSTMYENATSKEIDYNEFLTMLNNNKIEEVTVTGEGKIVIKPKESKSTNTGIEFTYWTTAISVEELHKELTAAADKTDVKFKADLSDSKSTIVDILFAYIVPFAIIYFFMGLIFKRMGGRGGALGVGKSTAKMYMEKETGVTFKDVAGQDEAKESVTEIVDFLHNPSKYTKIGAKLPKGALLVGPPGTGKTLLAKAVAGEAHVPFFSLSGSDFVELYVGVGASRVRDLFKTAQQNAPCIIFIDEIDAIGKTRDSKYGGGNDEREQTLNQLLSEMDGFDSSKGLLILAATNRPDVLDKALLRPGRFDRRIIVDKPDLKGRVEILKVHSRDVSMDETVDLEEIGLATSGAVGSDLANMINEAAINAVKHGRAAISQQDLLESVEVVIAGKEKKDRILNATEKKTVAYHEVGHALVTALEKNSEPVQKITIVPRTMGSLGYVMQVPEEEKYLMTKDELITRITTLLGGRAAEEISFETITTGASNDMEKATALARSMITQYGMSEKFGLMSLEKVEDSYLAGRTVLNCSDETAAEIDREVKELLKQCHDRARKLLSENQEILIKIADYLYEKETITGKQFMEIFNELKGIKPEASKEEVDANDNSKEEALDN